MITVKAIRDMADEGSFSQKLYDDTAIVAIKFAVAGVNFSAQWSDSHDGVYGFEFTTATAQRLLDIVSHAKPKEVSE